ncbi:MAG: FkbM family methyltransferase [Paracoccaceae bacterium]
MLTALRKSMYRLRGSVPVTLAGENYVCDPYHSKFWRKASSGAWEPETFRVLDRYLQADRDYLDIGAWIGPTVLYGARKAAKVWCFEPDPRAYRHLAWNIELNGLTNVSALPVALSGETGIARMASFGGETGDSMTSLLNTGGDGFSAVTLAWDTFAAQTDLSRVSLVKMDIEGAEFSVLPALVPWLKEHRPTLYLSTHAPFLPETDRVNAMAQLAETLSFYETATPDNEAAMSVRQALTSQGAHSRFCSFVFN